GRRDRRDPAGTPRRRVGRRCDAARVGARAPPPRHGARRRHASRSGVVGRLQRPRAREPLSRGIWRRDRRAARLARRRSRGRQLRHRRDAPHAPAPAPRRRLVHRRHAGPRRRREAAPPVPRAPSGARPGTGGDRRADAPPRRRDDRTGRHRVGGRAGACGAPARCARVAAAPRSRRAGDRRSMTRDLRPLFEPQSVAIVGVSTDPQKWGYWFARDALKGAHRRAVHFVGRSGGEVHGRPVHRTLADLPESPELVVLSVPASSLAAAVDEALAVGARALVAVAACLGVFDAGSDLDLASNPLPSGPIGLVSQSGNIALETGLLLADLGLGFSRLASVGNQADLDVTDVLRSLAAHEPTKAIGVYCEDFRDGRAFAEAARTAGKPVVLMTVGRTAAGSRAARSHTGALTSDLAAVDAACRAAGVHRVETPRELVDALQALLAAERPRGKRVAVVGDGGGYGA